MRFCIAGEFSTASAEEWQDNAKWFDVKLLIDVQGDNARER